MTVRRGVWLIAGTGLAYAYPCRCAWMSEWEHLNGRCPCWGRLDVGAMPAGCCGWGWPTLRRLWWMTGGRVPDLVPFVPLLTRQYDGS